jgi:tetratricopeptide (TPR) repeat protein
LPFARRREGRAFFSYDPNEPLGDYMVHLDHEDKVPWNEKFEVVSAPYRLMQSPCFQKSEGRMTCTTCHNPHERPTSSDRPCRACHAQAHESKPEASQNCVPCHMVRRQPDDARLTTFTDHRISRRPDRRPGPELPAYTGRPRVYWPHGGLDNPEARAREDVLGPLRATARVRFPALPPIGDGLVRFPSDPFLLTLAGEAFRLRNRVKEAEDYLRKAIAADPDQPEAYVNLGALLATQGRLDDAISMFRRAWAIDPNNQAARTNLERALRTRQ